MKGKRREMEGRNKIEKNVRIPNEPESVGKRVRRLQATVRSTAQPPAMARTRAGYPKQAAIPRINVQASKDTQIRGGGQTK